MSKVKKTFHLDESINEKLRKAAYLSKKSENKIVSNFLVAYLDDFILLYTKK
jgi:hypothetical protein